MPTVFNADSGTSTPTAQARAMRRYYRLHALIYDATRWTFLYGRRAVLRLLLERAQPKRVLEVGCGTGANLAYLLRYGAADLHLTGVDVSPDMLTRAKRATQHAVGRVQLVEQPYGGPDGYRPAPSPDVVLFSYALTMFNPGWEAALQSAWEDLPEGGCIAVVDFYDTPFAWFRRWMGANHVRMEGHLMPLLHQLFEAQHFSTPSAYGGVWRYFIFLGIKKG
jgi:S-adenosylmethionine-diacylgycerolhomoserine-N-methlytransferase